VILGLGDSAGMDFVERKGGERELIPLGRSELVSHPHVGESSGDP